MERQTRSASDIPETRLLAYCDAVACHCMTKWGSADVGGIVGCLLNYSLRMLLLGVMVGDEIKRKAALANLFELATKLEQLGIDEASWILQYVRSLDPHIEQAAQELRVVIPKNKSATNHAYFQRCLHRLRDHTGLKGIDLSLYWFLCHDDLYVTG